MKSLVLFCLLFFFAPSKQSGFENVKFDPKELELFISEYTLQITNFSDCPNTQDIVSREIAILELFESPNAHQFSDLFDNPYKDPEIRTYLREISRQYDHRLRVEFYDIEIKDCEVNHDGTLNAIVTMGKRLEFEEKSKDVQLVMGIVKRNGQLKVSWIRSPADYPAKKSCPLDLNNKDDLEAEMFNDFKSIASEAYLNEDYFTAKEYYERALYYQDDAESKRMLNKSEQKLTGLRLKEQADRLYNKQDYESARISYGTLASKYPEFKSYAKSKGLECRMKMREQHYQDLVSQGNRLYSIGYYTKAKEQYSKAAEIKGTMEISRLIEKCNQRNEKAIVAELKHAFGLIEENTKRSYAEAMEIYTRYEGSGKLTAQNYYIMARLMDRNHEKVRKRLGYSTRQMHFLAKEYCLKAMKKGHSDAKLLWTEHFNEKSRIGK